MSFREPVERTTLCTRSLTPADLASFRRAISREYYYQFVYDDLPIWGLVGRSLDASANGTDPSVPPRQMLFTHVTFEAQYNGDRVIEVSVASDRLAALDVSEGVDPPPSEATFTYSVTWRETDRAFSSRLDLFSEHQFRRQHLEIHWFSIVNSCVTVLLLTGFLTTILMRVLRADFVKYARDEEDPDDGDESGWKLVHGDVFRFPRGRAALAALVGAGSQVLALAVGLLGLATLGAFRPHGRGAVFSALVFLYVTTSAVAGYQAASYYRQLGGTKHARVLLLAGLALAGPLFLAFAVNNTIALAYGSTAALTPGAIAAVGGLWTLVTLPLLALGGVLGKNGKTQFAAPCRTNKYPREIPPLPWYRSTPVQMLLAGFLPFSAIYIELFYIFASVWGFHVYTIYPILAVVFAILCVVTAFITVALVYFQLAAEDHRWWWRAFLCGGSTGLFVYVYCIYYYVARSRMSGLLQASFYFGYNAVVCLAFFYMLGFVGWRASLAFVRRIYRAIKCE